MNVFTALAAVVGLVLLTALAAYSGFGAVGGALESAGWGVALVALARAVGLTGAGMAWGVLIEGRIIRRSPAYVTLRFIREAINSLFPVGQVGGDLVGARLLTFFGVGGGLALASVLVDLFVQVATLVPFVVVGITILAATSNDQVVASALSYGVLIAIPVVIGFFVALRIGASNAILERLVEFARRREWSALGHVTTLGENLERLWRSYRRLSAANLVHLTIWFFGATEVWIALTFMGHSVTFGEAVAIESVGQAVRAAAFAMPGGIGVQDGGLIAVCAGFGIPAEVALALALVKRIAEIVLGLPSLVAWQALEGRRLWFRASQ